MLWNAQNSASSSPVGQNCVGITQNYATEQPDMLISGKVRQTLDAVTGAT